MKVMDVKVSVNLKKIVNVILDCGYKAMLEITDGYDTIRFDTMNKGRLRLFYITDHTKSGYVREIRKFVEKKDKKFHSSFSLNTKETSTMKMITINVLDEYNERNRRFLVAKNISSYNSYYSVALIPKTKTIYFYKPSFLRSRELKQSYKEMLAIFEIKATRRIFGIKI